jgi:hypothetical protein
MAGRARLVILSGAMLAAPTAGCSDDVGDGVYDGDDAAPHTTGTLVAGPHTELAEVVPEGVSASPPLHGAWDGTGFVAIFEMSGTSTSTAARLSADGGFQRSRLIRDHQRGYIVGAACHPGGGGDCAYLARVNDLGAYELVRDDASASGTAPAPLGAAITGYTGQIPLFGALGDGYLIVGEDASYTRVDAAGTPTDATPVSLELAVLGYSTRLACDELGCSYAAPAEDAIGFVRFHADGTVDAPVMIDGLPSVDALACTADACLLVSTASATIIGRLVDRDGAPLGPAFAIDTVAGSSRVALAGADAAGFVVTTVRDVTPAYDGMVHAYRISTGGVVTASYDVMPTRGLYENDGSNLSWLERLMCGPPGCLVFARVAGSGPAARLGPTGVLGAPFEVVAANAQYGAGLVRSDDALGFVWSDRDLAGRLARWTPAGWVDAPSATLDGLDRPRAWNGRHYLAIRYDGIARYDASGTLIDVVTSLPFRASDLACHRRCFAVGDEGTYVIDQDSRVVVGSVRYGDHARYAAVAYGDGDDEWFAVPSPGDGGALSITRYDTTGAERGSVEIDARVVFDVRLLAVRNHLVVMWNTAAGNFARGVDADLDLGPAVSMTVDSTKGATAVIGDAVVVVTQDADLLGYHAYAFDHELSPLGAPVELLGPDPIMSVGYVGPIAGAIDDHALVGFTWLDPVRHVPRTAFVPLTIE